MAGDMATARRYARWMAVAALLGACDAGSVDEGKVDAGAPDGGAPVDAATPFDGSAPLFDGSAPLFDGSTQALPMADAGGAPDAGPSGSGRMAGMLEAHNAVRAAVDTSPPEPPLVWRDDIAAFAQAWADQLASAGCSIMHRSGSELQAKNYGENIAQLPARLGGKQGTPQAAVDAWAAEEACWTYGTLSGFGKTGTEKCDVACYTNLHSDGCGHYTAIVSRRSTAMGCGVATCKSGAFDSDIWVCNYNPAGNIVGMAPY